VTFGKTIIEQVGRLFDGSFPDFFQTPYFLNSSGQRWTSSVVPVSGQKGLQIGCGNPHQSIEPVRDQKALIDPAPNGAGANAEAPGDLLDREVLL
jgi:hypothetical protein